MRTRARTTTCAPDWPAALWRRRVPTPASPAGCARRTRREALEDDGVGADRYVRLARIHSGIDLDLAETYAWGWEDLDRITTRMNACAARLYGGVTPAEAQARLDVDPEHTVEGAEQARDWLQQITDDTIASFNGRYFEIPEQMLICEATLAPPGGSAMPYYTPPSEDFSRPGRTWLPVTGQKRFSTWWLTAAWYHEAVPGHHLQVAYTMTQKQRLSRFQRVEFVSGHGEGWALYAERLMDELGYYQDPAVELGYLSGQAIRACRVILDIGLHLDLPIPANAAPALFDGIQGDPRGGHWDRELARQFLSVRGIVPDGVCGQRGGSLSGLARAGHLLQGRRTGVAGGTGGRQSSRGCGVRPQGLAHARVGPGLGRPGCPARRAGSNLSCTVVPSASRASLQEDVMPEVLASLDDLLAGATDREVITDGAGKSGAVLERLTDRRGAVRPQAPGPHPRLDDASGGGPRRRLARAVAARDPHRSAGLLRPADRGGRADRGRLEPAHARRQRLADPGVRRRSSRWTTT